MKVIHIVNLWKPETFTMKTGDLIEDAVHRGVTFVN